MNTKNGIRIIMVFIVSIILITTIITNQKNQKEKFQMEGTIITLNEGLLKIESQDNTIYTFKMNQITAKKGDKILLEYLGLLDKTAEIQTNEILNYKVISVDNNISTNNLEQGIFKDYYDQAKKKLQELSIEEKIGQLLLVRYPEENAIKDLQTYKFGGFVFFEKDFKDKTKNEVKQMINELQKNSAIPLLTAVDEEGGKIVRLSSNKNLIDTPFKSSQELYQEGGFDLIRQDTINKSRFLYNLGLNLNLAPVVDVSTNTSDYMYSRSLGQNTDITSTYAKTVIIASKNTGVSYTLKHFPGYGNNQDTHTTSSIDQRSKTDIENNDLPPFLSGINAGAEAILVSHNIVTSIDKDNPASLSKDIHNLLQDDLNFTGVTITDDLDMGAISNIPDAIIKAINAGNDLIITTNYQQDVESIKKAIDNNSLSIEQINQHATKILAWKYYKGLFIENQK